MSLVFIETPYFIKRIDSVMTDEAQRAMQNELLLNAEKGDLIQGTGGCRKLRVADESRGKGKRGGFRVIYFLKDSKV
jgi:mRNA-degrading endonuclease RelE of RelBE toxin-antitoxin system